MCSLSLPSSSCSSLVCDECVSCHAYGDAISELNDFSSGGRSDEFVETLLSNEIAFGFGLENPTGFSSPSRMDEWLKTARLQVIRWVLDARAILGFRFHTAYLCMTYFDRFIRKRSVDREKTWVVRLLSVACLSLAAKMEEHRIPPWKVIQVEEYYFESKTIKRMELLVLNTLEWRMNSVTPFSFIHYFTEKLRGECLSRDSAFRVIDLVLAMMRESSLMDYRPSVVAAAVILMTFEGELTRSELEAKISSSSPCRLLQTEDVFFCYNWMKRFERETQNTAFSRDPPWMKLEETSSVTVADSAKRRKLHFGGSYRRG